MSSYMARLEKSLGYVARVIGQTGGPRSADEMNRWLEHLVMSDLTTVAEHMCDQVLKDHAVVKDAETLVHYTSLGAMVSMLEAAANAYGKDPAVVHPKPVFRLYDSVHLNDPDEGHYLMRTMAEHYDWLADSPSRNAYIASFITPNDAGALDNLSFWRAYGDEGTGCSMSLRIPPGLARRVRYGIKEIGFATDRLRPMLDALNRVAMAARAHPAKKAVRRFLAEAVAKSLEPIRYLYKSKAYEYEQECRVVRTLTGHEGVRFECRIHAGRPAHIRHYCEPTELLLRKLLVSGTSIVIGPRVPEPESVRSCFRTLLRRANIEGPEINFSRISYQAF